MLKFFNKLLGFNDVEEALLDALKHNQVDLAKKILFEHHMKIDPNYLINYEGVKGSFLHYLCRRHEVLMIDILLVFLSLKFKEPINLMLRDSNGNTPTDVICMLTDGHPYLKIFLEDERVHMNRCGDNTSSLLLSAENGNCRNITWIVASGKSMVFKTKQSIPKQHRIIDQKYEGTEVAHLMVCKTMTQFGFTAGAEKCDELLANTINSFLTSPSQTRARLRVELGYNLEDSARLFCLCLLLSEKYYE